jgi:hypothetical protein
VIVWKSLGWVTNGPVFRVFRATHNLGPHRVRSPFSPKAKAIADYCSIMHDTHTRCTMLSIGEQHFFVISLWYGLGSRDRTHNTTLPAAGDAHPSLLRSQRERLPGAAGSRFPAAPGPQIKRCLSTCHKNVLKIYVHRNRGTQGDESFLIILIIPVKDANSLYVSAVSICKNYYFPKGINLNESVQ